MKKRIMSLILVSFLFVIIIVGSSRAQENKNISTASSSSVCPADMMEIQGNFCPDVIQTCINLDTSITNVNGNPRCLEFAATKCLSKQKIPMHFCIDKYEASDKKGETPPIMISWYNSKSKCEDAGKRLCVDHEWSLACEGNEILPYPYGYRRDATACNIDHPQKSWFNAATSGMTMEIALKLDQRVPSGSMAGCVSPFGVYDMTGNVDEFVINSSGHPYVSGLMGGHWVKGARNRCRPETTVHGPTTVYYEISYRCCMDVPSITTSTRLVACKW